MVKIVRELLEKTAHDSTVWDMAAFLKQSGPQRLTFLNAHAVTTAQENPEFAQVLMQSDMLLRDGIGIKIALKLFSLGPTANLNGTDLITKILSQCDDRKLLVFGASDETMTAMAQKRQAEGYQSLQAVRNGFYPEDVYISEMQTQEADIILLCMGMPRQELLAEKLRLAGFGGLIICGGGWADFYSETKVRAPLFMRRFGMEWLFRLSREPRRLGKRYTVDIVRFLWLVYRNR